MGNFVVRKSKHYFSALPLDHAHEQANAVIKLMVEPLACLKTNQPRGDGLSLALR